MIAELKAESDDVFDAEAERELLERILGAYYSAVLAAVHEVVRATFVDVPGFDPDQFILEDSATVRLLAQAGTQIVRITETTRQAIASQLQVGAQRGYNTWQIAHGVPSENYRGINGLFRETWAGRAECLLPDTPITGAAVTAVWRRWYEGNVVQVITRSGRQLTATPNHPHLTQRGWLAADEITPGDNLVYHAGHQQSRPSGDVDIETAPATVAQIFDALSTIRVAYRRPTSYPDFHGDGREGYVDVLRPNGVLLVGCFTPLYQPVIDKLLTPTNLACTPYCQSCGLLLAINQPICKCATAQWHAGIAQVSHDQFFRAVKGVTDPLDRFARLVAANDVRGIQASPSLVGRTTTRSPATHQTTFPQRRPETMERRIARSSRVLESQSTDIQLDPVIDVARSRWSGHVFNLSTPYGYFCADGLYTGNTVARTELQNAQRLAAIDRYNATGLVDEVELIDGDEWDAVCASRNGKVVPLSQAPSLAHPNCLTPGQIVWAPKRQAGSTRWFDGEVIVIHTAAGDLLTVTPNHPVLTPTGWQAAGTLRQGDGVVRCTNPERMSARVDPDHQHRPALIEQVAQAAGPAGHRAATAVPLSAEAFDGEATAGDVCVIWADRGGEVGSRNPRSEPTVEQADVALQTLTSQRFEAEVLPRLRRSTNRGMRRGRIGESLLGRHARIADARGFAYLASQAVASQPLSDGALVHAESRRDLHDAELLVDIQRLQLRATGVAAPRRGESAPTQIPMQRRRADTDAASDLVERFPGLVAPVEIIQVERRDFAGHVYNVQTEQGWYIAQNIVTHNCTLVLVPVLRAGVV